MLLGVWTAGAAVAWRSCTVLDPGFFAGVTLLGGFSLGCVLSWAAPRLTLRFIVPWRASVCVLEWHVTDRICASESQLTTVSNRSDTFAPVWCFVQPAKDLIVHSAVLINKVRVLSENRMSHGCGVEM